MNLETYRMLLEDGHQLLGRVTSVGTISFNFEQDWQCTYHNVT